jgi:MATE family multidrug resistance protein
MIPVGISISTSILVGNNIGAYNLEAAKFYAKMCFITALIWSVLSVLVVVLLKDLMISMFSSEADVNTEIEKAYLTLSVFVFFDCMQCVGTGIIRGLGR